MKKVLITILLLTFSLAGIFTSSASAKDRTAKAVYNLTISKTGTGASSSSVISSLGGINCGLICSAAYDDTGGAKDVFLTARPGNGFHIASWGGNGTCVGDRCYLRMDSNKATTANFTSVPVGQQKINVSKDGSGNGTVVSSPAGINCTWYSWESTCSGLYTTNTLVTLQASSTNSIFDGWSGACASYTGPVCIINASQTQNVGVNFKRQYNLLIKKTGSGKGSVKLSSGATCSSERESCSYTFPAASAVTLHAEPDPGYIFKGWWHPTICTSSASKTCLVSIPQAGVEMRAKFIKKPKAFFERTPEKRTNRTRAYFTFDSIGKAKFKCSLDFGLFEKCRSPERMRNLAPGGHIFTIVPYVGSYEGRPVSYKWRVLEKKSRR